jgi:hypothetical protein
MLELKEVYALKAKFTSEHCQRITWVILDDGRTFFDDVKTTIDFTGPDMSFPQSYLIDILNNDRYAVPVERVSFPDEWCCKDCPKEVQSGKTIGGQGRGQNNTDTPSTRGGYGQAGGGNIQQSNYGQGGFGGRQGFPLYAGQCTNSFRNRGGNQQQMGPPYTDGGGRHNWRVGWTDVRHPKIKALMDLHLESNDGRIRLDELLNVAGRHQSDLPTLPCCCWPNGQLYLCWSSKLGRCMFPGCCYWRDGRHPGPNVILDDFAEKVVCMLAKTGGRVDPPQRSQNQSQLP